MDFKNARAPFSGGDTLIDRFGRSLQRQRSVTLRLPTQERLQVFLALLTYKGRAVYSSYSVNDNTYLVVSRTFRRIKHNYKWIKSASWLIHAEGNHWQKHTHANAVIGK